jgi:HK97 family phage prohead protease
MKITGYAAVFDVIDKGGDILRRQAFDDWLSKPPISLPLLWQHRRKECIGYIDYMELDDYGLRVAAILAADSSSYGKIVPLLLDDKLGLSFGYRAREAKRLTKHRELLAVELVEISLVMSPMQPLARIDPILPSGSLVIAA